MGVLCVQHSAASNITTANEDVMEKRERRRSEVTLFHFGGKLQGWRADMEALGNEWDGGTRCEIPKEPILKIRLKKE